MKRKSCLTPPTSVQQYTGIVVRIRSGVTLSEVLVSMLIMSVGVVSLATLFPISVLRTAQATQLNHSVFVRNNAEASLKSRFGLLSHSQIATPTTTATSFAIIDPLGAAIMPTVPFTATTFAGIVGLPRVSGRTTTLVQAQELAALPDTWTTVRDESITVPYNHSASPAQTFITVGAPISGLATNSVRNGQNPSNALHRMILTDATGKYALIKNLYQVTGSNLSWQNLDSGGSPLAAAGLPFAFDPVKVRIEAQERRYSWLMTVRKKWDQRGPLFGANGVPGNAGDDDNDGSTNWTNPPTNTNPDWDEFRWPGSDDDANWTADIDVVVFFNRSYRPTDEFQHTVTFNLNGLGFDSEEGVRNVNDDNAGLPDDPAELGFPGSDDNRTVTVDLSATPYLKKGAYVLLAQRDTGTGVLVGVEWYRVLDFDAAGNVLFDRDISYVSLGLTSYTFQGVFMRGIVEKYTLTPRSGNQ